MDASDALAAVSAALSLAAIVVSVVVARAQAALAGRERLLPVVSEVLRDSLTEEFRASREFVEERLHAENPRVADGLRGLDEAARERVRPIMGYFNNVGLLVANGTVPAEVVASTMGGSVVNAWLTLGPYVYAERVLRGGDPNYYGYFEHLAAIMRDLGPTRLETLLALRKWPPRSEA